MSNRISPLLPSIQVKKDRIISFNQAFKDLTGLEDIEISTYRLSENLSDIRFNNQDVSSIEQLITMQSQHLPEVLGQATIKDSNFFPLPVKIDIDFNQSKNSLTIYFQSFTNRSLDPISKLPNGWAISSRANHILATNLESPKHLAIIILNVDNFSTINYRYGFVIGDAYLEQLGKKLKSMLNNYFVVRYSNAKFGILIEDQQQLPVAKFKKKVEGICESLCDLSETPLRINQSLTIKKIFSIGVSSPYFQYKDYYAMEVAAETAMASAQKQSTTGYQFANLKVIQSLLSNKFIIDEFPSAMAQNQIEVFYQPQYKIKHGELIGFEALSRWKHPTMGNIPPDVFISIAQKIGFDYQFDLWVLKQVCQQINAWKEKKLTPPKVAINVSFKTVEMPDFINQVKNILSQTNCPVSLIEIEITETTSINNEKILKNNIIALKQLGFSIAVDDFGTGYSSLSLVRNYHSFFNKLKLDRSLIENICKTSTDQLFVKQIINLGKLLNLEVLAEGVENLEQLSMLGHLGCIYAQGFYFDKALSKFDAEFLISKSKKSEK